MSQKKRPQLRRNEPGPNPEPEAGLLLGDRDERFLAAAQDAQERGAA